MFPIFASRQWLSRCLVVVILLLSLFVGPSIEFNSPLTSSPTYVPPLLPLSPFPEVTGDQLVEYAEDVVGVITEATLPTNADQLIAIFISEAAAGFTGGLSERFTAFLVGDREGFQSGIKGSTAGTYFGVRSAIMSAARIFGLPPALAQLVADITASLVAEALKVAERKNEELKEEEELRILTESDIFDDPYEKSIQKLYAADPLDNFMLQSSDADDDGDIKDGNSNSTHATFNASIGVTSNVLDAAETYNKTSALTTYSSTTASINEVSNASSNGFTSFLSLPELVQDVTKWVTYDLILPDTFSDHVPLLQAAKYGALSGLAAHAVYELLKDKSKITNGKTIIRKYLQACIEGSVLFATYEGSVNFFKTSSTPEIRKFLLKEFTDFHFFGS